MAETVQEFAEAMDYAASHYLDDLARLLNSFAPLALADVQQNFATESTAGGEEWPERKDNLPHPLLHLSGALEEAATGGGANSIREINGDTLTLGVNGYGIPYAGRQNWGDRPGSRDILGREMNIPAREYMAIGEGTVDELSELAADFFASQF